MSVLPYGSWPTPVTSELVVLGAAAPAEVAVDGDDVWWTESRPAEHGRLALMRLAPGGPPVEVLAAPWNVRTAVHEYGGGAWWVRDGVVWFVDWSTQRLHRRAGDGPPVALTPEPEQARGLRYADGAVSPDGRAIVCVQERHPADGSGVVNAIVRLDAATPGDPEVLAEGADFYATPRWSPDGRSVCWLEWDHPDMPWDATRLVVDHDGERLVVAGAEVRESVFQPAWAPDGSLWCCADRGGFWSLHRWTPDGGLAVMLDIGRDIGVPHWVFGLRRYAFLPDGRVAFVFVEDGLDRLGVLEVDGSWRALDTAFTQLDGIAARGSALVFIAGGPRTEAHVVEVDPDRAGDATVLAPPRDLGVDEEMWSAPESIDFPTAGGQTAHALLYRPHHPDVSGPPGERPPLVVMIHGGPTSAARPVLKLATQYWTTRGFAVVDVNYRGSTGYGRAYRELLQGQWGIADVEDCVAVARFLADRGDVDPARLCIRGGSAGGFTTLAALTFSDVFAAGASHFGVADLGALAAETHKFESRYLDGLVGPWPAARAEYEARSPIHHTDQLDRPLVVFQGLEDEVVPPNQAEMIVDAVRSKGVPVAYLPFEGEQHGFRQAANIRAALDGELSFYAQVLRFELPAAEGITPIDVDNL